jgi:hypothetical protein
MRHVALMLALVVASSGTHAMVGAQPASDAVARRVALIVGSRGNFFPKLPFRRPSLTTGMVPLSHKRRAILPS